MYKKYLLSCTTAVSFLLLGFHLDANAQRIVIDDGRTENISDLTLSAVSPRPEHGGVYVTDGTLNGSDLIIFGTAGNGYGATADGNNAITHNGGKSIIQFQDTLIRYVTVGLFAKDRGQITMINGSIRDAETAVISESTWTTHNPQATNVILNNVVIEAKVALYTKGPNANIIMTGGTIAATQNAFTVENGGMIRVTDVSATADEIGIILANTNNDKRPNRIDLTNTKLIVENGIGIIGSAENSIINLNNSEIRADLLLNSINVDENKNPARLNLKAENSILEGNVRIAANDTVSFDLTNTTWYLKISNEKDANGNLLSIKDRSHSQLSTLKLKDSSIIFKEPTGNNYQTLLISAQRPASFIEDQDLNQKNQTAIYSAEGNTQIHFNTVWSDGAKITDQKTDRVLIHGDVSGTTMIHVNVKEGDNVQKDTSLPWNQRGVSLIQVSGIANENSFKLANGYTTLNGTPYKYILYAYGKGSSHGGASAGQNIVSDGDDFWDFRLQGEYLPPPPDPNPEGPDTGKPDTGEPDTGGPDTGGPDTGEPDTGGPDTGEPDTGGPDTGGPDTGEPDTGGPDTGGPDTDGRVQALVPQAASYIVLPNALFSTGITDMNYQNAFLANMRSMSLFMKGQRKNTFLASTYSDTTTFSSERTAWEYGYGADIQYTALQTGVVLETLESQNITTDFGLLGTYGQLFFTPKNMADASKSTLNKLSLTAYSSTQHNNGLYADILLSYGLISGNITNALIGNTAQVDGTQTLSLSATIGKPLAIGIADLTFEPQAQLAYQRLMFGTISDIDGFKVDIGSPEQWLMRIGGRLTKTLTSLQQGKAVSFYSKLDLIKTFGDEGSIKIGDDFKRDPTGSFVEGGLGVNMQLSAKFSLYGDISHRRKLQKSGISGNSFSAGIRFRF
ncbi:hypothetical protein H704_01019 [Bartonella bacilliformis Peru38]|uniref:autotransporter outer membrane beta-barrel domain-containing protein n=1 Tax=Bartonella bacilliformis TaxID=774 RepID=UPI00044A04E7|nr:autotransporter outer membrane beta-barrel domain-containing protein [Bartonella bacilliformis]EYS94390.1 hypothetical protein X470_01094 [Bartonella bacilliformis Peru-18]KEG15877.1 hypothetical protein H709_00993 [Bartonella bacilliformis CUSCO5]KEG19780.1 hypothetical protein H704_01019 [Bartonella bacilliformis Peru38]KEG22184.1 hypothetical protein H703_01009 [Bartonella bacilliformis Ver075]KZM37490.1 hypothetical protein AWH67_04945 [Bartonella bacilliformis]